MSKKIISAGHICLDITPVFISEKARKIEQVLIPGRLIPMREADVHTGGSVGNTGLALKVLGADVTLIGKIGNDDFGKIVLEKLQEYDAEKGMLICEGETTAYSVVLAIPGIDRIFLHNPGGNKTYQMSDISDDALEDAALFHFGYPPLMERMYVDDGEELVKLMKHVKGKGIATSLDMALVEPDPEVEQPDWNLILKRVLPYVDIFAPSVEELCFMLDRERYTEWQERAAGRDVTEILDIETDVKPLAEQCLKFGAKVILIKCGAPGIYYRTADNRTLKDVGRKVELDIETWANAEGFEKSYVPEQVLSGTGAGDTSIAAFLKAMLDGYSIEKCVQLATATGASCVEAYDALSGLKSFEELEAKIASGWKKNE